jgi:hypothetical protein
MVFCGQCGYQLAPGDTICPRCGAKTDADLIEYDPGTYNPTEVSQAIIERAPTQAVRPPTYTNQASWPNQPEQGGPLILGPVAPNSQIANEPTAMMNAPTYAPQPSYPAYGAYPQQPGATGFAYNPAGYQAGQSAVVEQILEASRRGKVISLLLILFGLLLLIAAIVVFLLNQQGML